MSVVSDMLRDPDRVFSMDEAGAYLARLARQACATQVRRLTRGVWLEVLMLPGVLFASIDLLLQRGGSVVGALGLVAATLLIVANQRSARKLTAGLLVGSEQLVEVIIENLEFLKNANATQ